MSKPLPWFRLYGEAIDDEKLLLLSPADRWYYVAILCLKSQGILDGEHADLRRRKARVKLRLDADEFDEMARRLEEVGLICAETLNPLAWEDRQFISDSSAERVKRHREKRKAAGLPGQNFFPPALREDVLVTDGNACVYCGASDDLTIDHKVPEARGGTNERANLHTACRVCNAKKRDLTHEEYLQRISNGQVTSKSLSKTTDTESEPERKAKPARTRAAALPAPPGVPLQLWQDWLTVRKAKSAPLTATALEGVKREAAKAKMSVSDAIKISVENGWAGFKFSWLQEQAARSAKAGAPAAADKAWHQTASGIKEKARELGIEEGDDWLAFRAKVYERAGVVA